MRINHAIIGCGRVSHNHLYACSKLKNVDVVHFCDVDLNKAKELSSKVPLAFCCSDYTEIISNPRIDSVSVCTDHGSHYDIAIKCIQNDKHVIIEKPVCIRDEDARELEIISKMHPNVTISVVSQHRYDPLVNAVYNIIQSASIGKVTAISGFVQCSKKEEYYNGWRGKLSTEGGSALINQGIHTLDLMIWMGGNIEKGL